MKKLTAVSLALMLFCGLSTSAFSFEHYVYRGGHYYRDAGWWGLGGFLAGLAVGSYVASLPPDYQTVVIDGTPYYYADGYYYETGPNGYVVVEPPAGQLPLPGGGGPMTSIIEVLLAVLLLAGIGLLVKKLLTREAKTA